jgi:uncharacterized protein involved in tellurium resistance
MSDEIDNIVTGSITADTTTTPREGFGVLCAMAYHTKNADPYRDYSAQSDMLSDGFALSDASVRMVSAALKQNPRPKFVRLGRMTTAVKHTVALTVTAAADGKIASVLITDAAGVEHAISHTIAGGEGANGAATALAALITALAGVQTAAAVGAVITVTIVAAGDVWFYDSLVGIDYVDSTPDASIDTDLGNMINVDDGFYGVTISLGSKANADKVDSWCETNKKLFACQTADSREKRTGTSVLGAAITAAKYTHTLPMYHSKPKQYMGCAWLGAMLPKNPGSAAFALKQLPGVDIDVLTQTEKNALNTNGLNYYVKGGSRGLTRKKGTVGSGERADVILGKDWLDNEMKTSVFDLLAQADKVDMDDGGIAKVENVMRDVLKLGVRNNFLEAGNGDDIPAPTVQPLKVSDIPTVDRADGLLSGIKWSANMTNAILAVDYSGVLSF